MRLTGYGFFLLALTMDAAAAVPGVTLSSCAQAPVIDGRLDDACWKAAASLSAFVQIRPGDNAPPSRETTVLLTRDANALYLGIRAFDDPKSIRATVAHRDAVLADDHVTLYLDTFDDHRRAYVLTFNPLGVQQDGVYAEGREIDYSVDLVMRSTGQLTADGYTIEVALPFSSIRFKAGSGHRWGLHVERNVLHLDEQLSWMPRIRGSASLLDQAGTIEGLDNLGSGRTIEVIPGLTVAQSGERPTVGRFETSPVDTDPSLTMKLALSSSLVVDAAVNPDFAQIESDQLVSTANQRFPIFFDEKRPFFLEGIDIFQTPLNAVHSRTIVDPDYATKVTGKIGRSTFAALVSSDNAPGSFITDDRLRGKNATSGVLRLRRDVGEQSYLGAIATSYAFVDKRGQLAGFDGRVALDANTVASFQLLGTTSDTAFFEPTLGRSIHRSGQGLGFFAEWKRSGRHLNITLQGEGRTQDYRADLGFTTQTNTNRWSVMTRYDSEPRPDARMLLSWSFSNTVLGQWDWQGRAKYAYVYPRVQLDFRRQTRLTLFAYADYLRLFEEEFGARRGASQSGAFFGAPERSTVYKGTMFALETAPSKKVSLSLSVDHAWDQFDFDFGAPPRYPRVSPAALEDPNAPLDPGPGRSLYVAASLELKPLDSLRVSLAHTRNRLVRNDTGRVAYDERLYSLQSTIQFSAFLFARGRIDYDLLRSNARGQILLGWTPIPGTSLYGGYTDELTRETGWIRNNRTVFVKASYLVRRAW